MVLFIDGFKEAWSEKRHWPVEDLQIDLMEYGFKRDLFSGGDRIVVANFMLLPTGLGLDMKDVQAVAHDPAKRVYGAGQLQLTFDESVPVDQRRSIYEEFVAAHRPFIEAATGRQTDDPQQDQHLAINADSI